MVGVARLTLTGQPGQTVTIRYGEVLNPDGTLYTDNLRGAKATDHYTFATDRPGDLPAALHLPRLPVRRGERPPAAPPASAITGVVMGTDGAADEHVPHQLGTGEPAAQQHRLGSARQLPVDPDRHSGARRADGLDRRHQRVRPDSRLQPGLAGVPDQVAAGPARQPGAPTARTPSVAPTVPNSFDGGTGQRGLGRCRGQRAVDAVAGVRRHVGDPRSTTTRWRGTSTTWSRSSHRPDPRRW